MRTRFSTSEPNSGNTALAFTPAGEKAPQHGPYSADVQSLLKDESADRLYLHVQIPGYPDGYLSLISPMR